MARLTADQWADLRAEWEVSPKQGLTWLTRAAGGRWDVTEEGIRKRRLAEGWQKRGTLASVVEKAQLAADAKGQQEAQAARGEAPFFAPNHPTLPPTSSPTSQPTTEEQERRAAQQSGRVEAIAVDLRAELIERHRKEWQIARGLSAEAVKARDFDKAKLAKITTETIKLIQEGERRAWGLDATADVSSMSDEQLEALVKGSR